MKKNQVRYALNSFSLTLVNFTTKFLGICDTLSYILLSLNYTWVDKRGIYHSLEKPFEILGRFGIRGCYVIVFIVSYREITNKMFSLTQSKLYIFLVSGPNKSNKERLK